MVKKKYKVSGMHCTSCALMIEAEVEDLGARAHCSFAKEEVEVEFDERKIQENQIKKAVERAGYIIN